MRFRSLRRRIAPLVAAALLFGVIPGSAGAAGLPRAAQTVRVIVVARDEPGARTEVDNLIQSMGGKVTHRYGMLPGFIADVPLTALSSLSASASVAAVSTDRRESLPPLPEPARDLQLLSDLATGSAAATSADRPELSPLGLSLTHAPEAWALGITGAGVRVCVIDTGVDFSHPDLAGTALLGPDGKAMAVDFTSTDLQDTYGHATGVAGMIAAQGKGVYQVVDPAGLKAGLPPVYTRIRGMAPQARLMSAKVFDSRVPYGGGWDSWIISALDWAVQNGAQIVNLSLGGGVVPEDGRDPLSLAVTAARENGVTVMVAAGNEGGGSGTIGTPATGAGALAIGASTMYRSFAEIGFLTTGSRYTGDQLAGFSSLGPTSDGRVKPYVLSPGAFDWSLAPVNGSAEGQLFQLFGGTSQATPVAAGAMAMVYEAYRVRHGYWPRPAAAEKLLVGTADDLGYPASLQGNGRINVAAAVRAALGLGGVVAGVSEAGPRLVQAGSTRPLDVALYNEGVGPVDVAATATQLAFDEAATFTASGTASAANATVDFPLQVPTGYDLLDAMVTWPSEDPGTRSARFLVALYDPAGNFVNYQRPNVGGDQEFGHAVHTRAGHPATGKWTVSVQLRYAKPGIAMPFNLTVRLGRRAAWPWLQISNPDLHLAGRASGNLRFRLSVPAGTPAGTYVGEIDVRAGGHLQTLPVSVVVPIAVSGGVGSFSGEVSHGYQGSFNDGDWRYYTFHVPGGTRGLLTTLAWPDADNALEFYLVNPRGDAVNAKANDFDLIFTGKSKVRAEQIAVADPMGGDWQIVVHSFGFYGGAKPEPFTGAVRLDPKMAGAASLSLVAEAGSSTTATLHLTNPGVAPETVSAFGQGSGLAVQTYAVGGSITGVANPDGTTTGQVLFGGLPVPPDASTVLVYLNWDNPGVNLALELADPTWSSKNEAAGSGNFVLVAHRQPAPGLWNVVLTFASPNSAGQTANFNGAFVTVAPPQIAGVSSPLVTIPPGGSIDLPVTFTAASTPGTSSGRLLVVSVDGDVLAAVPFTLWSY